MSPAGIIPAMTERGLPSADGSPACPFVAFEDERDERADRPDHRHRCYAEPEPAPRALAHQEAYCLSSAFPVCPTFQEWARREAAHARAGGTAAATPAGATVASASATGPSTGDTGGDPARGDTTDAADDDPWSRGGDERPIEERPRRNPPRDWAAPPPWATGAAGAAAGAAAAGSAACGRARLLARPTSWPRARSKGAGSPAARPIDSRVAGTSPGRISMSSRAAGRRQVIRRSDADPELARLVAGWGGGGVRDSQDGAPPAARSSRQPTVSSTRDRDRERERQRERERERGHAADGPAWEGQRRYEAYPQIRSRASMPGMPGRPRLAVLASALAIAAVVLFFLPDIVGIFGGAGPRATPTPTPAVATPTPEPTPEPAPTPQVYVIKEGDTLSKIARSFGLTLDELLAANKDTIENPDRIKVGDEIVIPVPVPEEFGGGSASPSAAP